MGTDTIEHTVAMKPVEPLGGISGPQRFRIRFGGAVGDAGLRLGEHLRSGRVHDIAAPAQMFSELVTQPPGTGRGQLPFS